MKILRNHKSVKETTIFELGVGINTETNLQGAKAAFEILSFCEKNSINVSAKTEVIGMGKKTVYSFCFSNAQIPNFIHNLKQSVGFDSNWNSLSDYKEDDQVLTNLDNLLFSLLDGKY